MKRALILAALTAATAAHAYGEMAYLVKQQVVASVTGQRMTVCTYQYGRQQFTRNVLGTGGCPQSVPVQ